VQKKIAKQLTYAMASNLETQGMGA